MRSVRYAHRPWSHARGKFVYKRCQIEVQLLKLCKPTPRLTARSSINQPVPMLVRLPLVRGFSKRKRKCFISYRRLLKREYPSVNAAKLVFLRYKDPQRQAKKHRELRR